MSRRVARTRGTVRSEELRSRPTRSRWRRRSDHAPGHPVQGARRAYPDGVVLGRLPARGAVCVTFVVVAIGCSSGGGSSPPTAPTTLTTTAGSSGSSVGAPAAGANTTAGPQRLAGTGPDPAALPSGPAGTASTSAPAPAATGEVSVTRPEFDLDNPGPATSVVPPKPTTTLPGSEL